MWQLTILRKHRTRLKFTTEAVQWYVYDFSCFVIICICCFTLAACFKTDKNRTGTRRVADLNKADSSSLRLPSILPHEYLPCVPKRSKGPNMNSPWVTLHHEFTSLPQPSLENNDSKEWTPGDFCTVTRRQKSVFHEGVCMYSSEGTVLSQKMCMCVLLCARVCGKKWQMVAGVCCRWSSCRREDVQQQDKARKHECTRVCVCERER